MKRNKYLTQRLTTKAALFVTIKSTLKRMISHIWVQKNESLLIEERLTNALINNKKTYSYSFHVNQKHGNLKYVCGIGMKIAH